MGGRRASCDRRGRMWLVCQVLLSLLLVATWTAHAAKPSLLSRIRKLRVPHMRAQRVAALLAEREQMRLSDIPPDPDDGQMAQFSSDIYDGCISPGNCDVAFSIRYDIMENPDKCFVIFRGTVDLNNFVTDMQFSQTANQFGDGNVHTGFQDAYNTVKREALFDAAIHRCAARDPPTPVYFTGHSLGGAVATLAILDFHREFPSITVRFATFGSPRVGDAGFQTYFVSQLPGAGNRYEAVRPPHDVTILDHPITTISPRGDGALPGDPVPRLPPMKDSLVVLGDLASSEFWVSTKALGFLGIDIPADGYRHVGVRFQLDCDNLVNLLGCHSMKTVYLPAVKAGTVFQV